MLSFYLIWSLSYLTLLWWMSRYWPERPKLEVQETFLPMVTLLIPFRNESKNIPKLIKNLLKFSYPNLEILLIDDHSEDDSVELLQMSLEGKNEIKILSSAKNGKKSALEYGVNCASGEIILCSDADCRFPDLWVEKMVCSFQNPKVQLVAGPVMVEGNSGFLKVFQMLDWASILLVTNYSFTKKEPLICSGANLAYRKEAFLQVGGYEGNREFVSGDDEFLLKKIHNTYGAGACCYLASAETLVNTDAEGSWKDLINQRVRWTSKWKAHMSISHAASAVVALLVQLVWLGSIFLISLGAKGILAFGIVWLVKVTAEKVSLGRVLESIDKKQSSFSFLKTSFVHPFYVIWVGIGALSGKFTWKGREN